MKDKLGYIYKTTNLINQKIYIGQKRGRFNPGYFGSGVYITKAINKYGDAVMGRGLALEARERIPGIERELGRKLRDHPEDEVYCLDECWVRGVPTKYHYGDKTASLDLIERAVWWFKAEAAGWPDKTYIMPRLGTGLGGLDWEAVKIFLEELPSNVWVVTL